MWRVWHPPPHPPGAGAAPRPSPHPARQAGGTHSLGRACHPLWKQRCSSCWQACAGANSVKGPYLLISRRDALSQKEACTTRPALASQLSCGSRAAGPARESSGPAGGPLARSGARSPRLTQDQASGDMSAGSWVRVTMQAQRKKHMPLCPFCAYRPRSRGSSRSRRPAPRRLKPVTTIKIARAGKVASHHWVAI